MFKKYLFIPLTLAALTGVYIVICFAVYLTKGRNRNLIKRKIKIGSLIIAMQALIVSPVFAREQPMCYSTVAVSTFELLYNGQYYNDGSIKVNLEESNQIAGHDYGEREAASFVLKNKAGAVVMQGNLGVTAEDRDFEILLDENLPEGRYMLYLYEYRTDQLNSNPGLENDFSVSFLVEINVS